MTIENVTVVFTDMVGSTALASSLTPDNADDVRRGHFSVLRQAIAESGGTEVKNLGDGLMVAFSVPSSALSCAVAMQQGVELTNRDGGHHIGLRIGLSGGEATKEDGDYFGDPVVEAARLCAKAQSGQILASDTVRGMAGRRNHHSCRPVGDLELKGLPAAIPTVEVLWEPRTDRQSAGDIPLPTRLATRPPSPIVGRDEELQGIADSAKRLAEQGGCEILLLAGEAGIGKTTVVAQGARTAFEAKAVVLLGHCEEDLASPYQLLGEAIGHYIANAPEDLLTAHVASHGSELSRITPALASRLPDLPPSKAIDSDTERFLLFASVAGILARASAERLVILVLDDLQWADPASLSILRYLASSEHQMRLLILGTFRDTELSKSHPFLETLAALRRTGRLTKFDLAGLNDDEVLACMESIAGHTLDADGVTLAHAVYRETDGNPFFFTEVLRHLWETGSIAQDEEGRWAAAVGMGDIGFPDSIREVVGARVGRLGVRAERVLELAAVIGRDFDLELLTEAAGMPEDDVLDVLDAAASAALVRELPETPGRYSFTHALIQHALYEDLGATRRARAHRRVAESLEALHGEESAAWVGELARHWLKATQPSELRKAIDYARRAGDAALEALAPADALQRYLQALELYPEWTDPDPVLALDLAIGLGTAQRQTGDPAFRETLLAAAHRAADLGDVERLVAAALANDRGTFSTVDTVDSEKIEVLESALSRLPEAHADRALVLAILCSELTINSPLTRREALADEAVAVARRSGDDAVLVKVLNQVLIPLALPPLLDLSVARSSEALERAERLGDPMLLCSAASGRRFTSACQGDIEEMDRCLDIKTPLVARLDQPFLHWVEALQRATRALIAGDTDEAETLAADALRIGTECGQPDAVVVYGAQSIMVSLWRGTVDLIIPLIEQTVRDNPGLPVFAAALALAHAESGHLDEARSLLDTFAASGFDLPMDATWLTGMTAYAEAAIGCRDRACASQIFEQLAPFADQWLYTDVAAYGPVCRLLGGLATVLGRFDQADALFSQALRSSTRAGARYFAAQSGLGWGTMLLERRLPGDAEHARELLTEARTIASAGGYANVERRAAAALETVDPIS